MIERVIKEDILEILDAMSKTGAVEWKGNNRENFSINWTPPGELADAIYDWAKSNKLVGYTETLDGIASGEDTTRSMSIYFSGHPEFFELPKDQILRACQILEESDRVDLFEIDGLYSVKFK